MAVDDHGLEALRKAAEEVTPGSKADYYIKVGDANGVSPGDVSTTPKIYNITVGTSEVEQALSANTKQFSIKVRGTEATLRLAYVATETATNYVEIPPSNSYLEMAFNAPSLTLYLLSDLAAQTVEIVEWS